MLRIQPARADDVATLVQLLGAHIPDVAPDTVWHVPWNWRDYHVVWSGQRAIGAGSLQSLEQGDGEIRGIAVDSEHRGQGVATLIVDHLLKEARERAVRPVCVTRKPAFFRRFGFEETLPSWLDLRRRPHEVSQHVDGLSQPRVTMALARGGAC